MKRKALYLFLMFFAILFIQAGCNILKDDGNSQESDEVSDASNPVAIITMEDESEIKVELFPEVAPNTVNNFITLIEKEFYDEVTFHRVIPEFMIQGGDRRGDGTGDPGHSIPGEFTANDFPNELKHERGVISMARSADPDSAGSQFFIVVEDSPHLDGEYAAFGKVFTGMDVVDQIVGVERDAQDKPLEDQTIESITVELNDHVVEEVIKTDD